MTTIRIPNDASCDAVSIDDYDAGSDGRRRGAAAVVFDAAGTQVASSRSFCVAQR